MIRLLEGKIARGCEDEFAAAARSFLRHSYDVQGLRRARIARRVTDEGIEFAWISEWDDSVDLRSLLGEPDATPRFVEDYPHLVDSWSVRHLEVFDDFIWDEEDELHRLLVGGSR